MRGIKLLPNLLFVAAPDKSGTPTVMSNFGVKLRKMMKRDINILIVEDQKILRKTLGIILKEEGYNITCADNGEKAVELAEKKFFNIAIIDIRLPGISGLDVLRTIREINHYICGIIITAYASIDTVINAIKEDAYDYLIKPLDFDRLKEIIEKGLEKQRLEIENIKLIDNLQTANKKLKGGI